MSVSNHHRRRSALRRGSLACGGAAVACLSVTNTAQAAINGFNNLTGWTVNIADTGTISVPNANTIEITNGKQRRSIFYDTPQSIDSFSATFTYQATTTFNAANYQGITFVLQNSAAGPNALGSFIGYQGISNSVAIPLAFYSGASDSGYATNGTVGAGLESIAPANIENHRALDVTVSYASPVLHVTVDDPTLAGVEFDRNYFVPDLANVVGGSTAYVGFTAQTIDAFDNGSADQFLSNFRFANTPEPGTLVATMGFATLVRRKRR